VLVPRASDEPECNVRIVPHPRTAAASDGDAMLGHYLVLDGEGRVHETGASDRHQALRDLGRFSLRGTPPPLVLLLPDGTPTGDRIG
jgi:hypothetical protein